MCSTGVALIGGHLTVERTARYNNSRESTNERDRSSRGRCRRRTAARLRLEMLRQLQALRLIVRADALAIELVRPRQHLLVDEAADGLAGLEGERHLRRAPLERGARAAPAGARIAEAGIEEARIMHAELAHQRIERHHLGRIVGRNLHGLLRGQDVKLVRIEDEVLVAPRRDRLPEFPDVVAGAAGDVDEGGMTLGAVAGAGGET